MRVHRSSVKTLWSRKYAWGSCLDAHIETIEPYCWKIVAKFFLSILLAAIVTSAAWDTSVVHAETFQRGDYALMDVPDISQALNFFRNVLDCEATDDVATSARRALMICENGMVVELVSGPADGTSATSAPLRFLINDVANADRWLQRDGARVIGRAVMLSSGPDAGQILVNFIAPWGQPLQLVGPADPRR